MRLTTSERAVRAQLDSQLSSLFSLSGEETAAIDVAWDATLGRLETCFLHIRNKYYSCKGETLFDPLHGCQWAHFLYTLSNEIYRRGGGSFRVR